MTKVPKNCVFYHVQEIPGLTKPTVGPFDLRENIDQLLGNCNFKNKKVLELGPASGFITFYLESLGAKVTCIDLSIKKDKWDIVPHANKNWKKNQLYSLKVLSKNRNAFWFAHKQHKSKAKLIETHIYNLPKSTPIHDYGIVASVLLHIQNPFLALQKISSKVNDKIIISDLMDDMGKLSSKSKFKLSNVSKYLSRKYFHKNTFTKFLPRGGNTNLNYNTWWKLSTATIIEMMKILGFEKEKYLEHVQYCNNKPLDMYTIVFKRKKKLSTS
ncbi:hypothetical protein N9H84_04550 [Candidatus Pelagibacter sp.]|nr:hypothetical protein [Candidatus Pelagibacter sp.]